MLSVCVVFTSLLLFFSHSSSEHMGGRFSDCKYTPSSQENVMIPIYWISSNRNIPRRRYMEKQLRDLGLLYRAYRINAILPSLPSFNITKLDTPCGRNTLKDAACVASHLKAIFTAIYNPYNQKNMTSQWSTSSSFADSEYALILEDDVKFEFKIDFERLIQSVPDRNFGILQLVTSNIEALNSLFTSYKTGTDGYWTLSKWSDRTLDGKTALYWSTQAYVINKRVVKALIDDAVDVYRDFNGHIKISFKLISSFFLSSCKRSKKYPCVLSNCLFADSYIYSGAGPTYVSKLPLFNGAEIGSSSDMHNDQVSVHRAAFSRIRDIQRYLKTIIRNTSNRDILIDDFLRPLTCG